MLKRTWFILLTLGLVALLALAACGDDDDDTGDDGDDGGELSADEQAAVDYMNGTLIELFNTGEYEPFIAEFTDAGLHAFVQDDETPVEELREQAPLFLEGEPPVENAEFPDVEANGDTVTVRITSTSGNVAQNEVFTLVKEDDDFQVDNFERLAVELPDGVSALEVSGVDFAYEFDGADAADGVRAVNFTNDGEQFHEMLFIQTTADAPELDTLVEDVLNSGDDEFPEWIENFIGALNAPPGGSDTIAFTEDLPAGRYFMICMIPDETQGEEGPPHSTLGMAAEFTIE